MRLFRSFVFLLVALAAFVAGYGYRRWYAIPDVVQARAEGRRILYYYDPMHPTYKSDKPGTAPDCGMTLVPFYADEAEKAPAHSGDSKMPADLPMGTIKVSPEKQQLIGVKYGQPSFAVSTKTIRAVGKVTPDE